jgi:spore coat protein U-like protein
MTRFVPALCCALLAASASAQQRVQPLRGDRAKPPSSCPANPATCQINAQTFDFGRGQMSQSAPAINGYNTVSVSCIRGENTADSEVQIDFHLGAVPAEPVRYMRDSQLEYLRYFMYVDAARLRYWGDGTGSTFTFDGTLTLDNRNPVGTLVFPVYGKVDAGQTALPGQWLGAVVTRLQYQVTCR